MPSYNLNINNKTYKADVDADTPLLWVLRDILDLTGTKFGCGVGSCGACTILFNGKSVRSCQLQVQAVGEAKITTIEGLSEDGSHPVQKAWEKAGVPQCGYCQSGQIMTVAGLLNTNKHPTEEQISTAMAGNLCRCGTYHRIKEAILEAIAK
ncbi:(2Fe-2S)-binding protein [Flavihumibacter fluvii]|uniref:(2Fe-2S)-binding protein n=1 Tax=Flavihumibacter fluvii TaxID=2838157 RepID=UPI001BDF0E82|nr:(2Fe-2S)-binding protein [Flavihumibacter fluvii]ULQ54723.1 (2Fe-2S)-binding protein [Flavihumibacter fluvii]